MNAQANPEFSAVITCYNEVDTIDRFMELLVQAFQELDRPYEIILVNDGSTDGTLERLQAAYEKYGRVTVLLDLFRNSGQLAAMTAGICEARGDTVLFLDCDLQLDPLELPRLVARYDEGCDVVSGYRKNRQDSWLRRFPSYIANMIGRRAARHDLLDLGCTFKLFDARLLRAFNFGPQSIFNPLTTIARAGRLAQLPVSHFPRPHGRSGWTFRKLWAYNMDNLIYVTMRPFQVLAVAALALGLLFTLRIAVAFFLPFSVLPEVSNGLVLNALAVVGLGLLSVLCVVGEYTIRCFARTKGLPVYIVKEERRKRDTPPQAGDRP